VGPSGERRQLVPESVAVWRCTLSASGRALAYTVQVRSAEDDAEELRVVDVESGLERALLRVSGLEDVQWSSDGEALLYAAGGMLRRVGVAGGPPSLVAPKAVGFHASPTEALVAFQRPDERGIDVVTEAGAVRPLVRGTDVGGIVGWSPDGRLLAYDQGRTLRVVARDGTNPHVVAGTFDGLAFLSARWAPDSSAIAYVTGGLWVAPLDGTPRRMLVPDAFVDALPSGPPVASFVAWSPDSDRLAYVSSSGRERGEVAVVRADGTGARTLTHTRADPEANPVEVRRWSDASVAASFEAGARVQALALSGNRVALLVRDGATRRLELRGTDGTVRRSVSVPSTVAPGLSMSSSRVVYRIGPTIKALDVRSGRISTLSVAQGTVVGLSIEGRRLAWGERRRGPDRIRALTLPA